MSGPVSFRAYGRLLFHAAYGEPCRPGIGTCEKGRTYLLFYAIHLKGLYACSGIQSVLSAASEGNCSRAAGLLPLSRPALSRQIKEPEDHLGVALFVRNIRQMSLTPDGIRLRIHAREIVTEELFISLQRFTTGALLPG